MTFGVRTGGLEVCRERWDVFVPRLLHFLSPASRLSSTKVFIGGWSFCDEKWMAFSSWKDVWNSSRMAGSMVHSEYLIDTSKMCHAHGKITRVPLRGIDAFSYLYEGVVTSLLSATSMAACWQVNNKQTTHPCDINVLKSLKSSSTSLLFSTPSSFLPTAKPLN